MSTEEDITNPIETDQNVDGPVDNQEPTVPEISDDEQVALEHEQLLLDVAVRKAQVEHLTVRIAELARENARLKAAAK